MGSARTLYDKAVANLQTAQILFDYDGADVAAQETAAIAALEAESD